MSSLVDPASCKHLRMQLIARDEETEYWECLDCGQIVEPGEKPAAQQTSFPESLSDA